MLYCPHCHRPSARSHGACPHCGKDLASGESAEPSKSDGTARAGGSRLGGVEFELEHGASGSDLELAGDDYTVTSAYSGQETGSPVGDLELGTGSADEPALQLARIDEPQVSAQTETTAQSAQIDDDEVRATAGFGTPKPGPLGAIRYALRIQGRLRELAVQLDRAFANQTSVADRLEAIRADLGRKARDTGVAGDDLREAISLAERADGEVSDAESQRAELESQHRARVGDLEAAIARLESETQPIREEEVEANKRLEALRTDSKRANAKLKRAEIELRNLNGMIVKRQAAYADMEKPAEERQRLLAEINGFERDLEPLQQRIEQYRAEVQAIEQPIVHAEAALTAVRGRVGEKLTQLSTLRNEVDQLTNSFSSASGRAVASIEEEGRRAEEAWSAVGERVFYSLAQSGSGILVDEREATSAALERVADATRKVELLSRARDSYDHHLVKQGKQYAIVGGVLILALVALSIYFIAG